MNLPNKLTVLRMALIPVFLIFAMFEAIPHHYLFAAVIFAAASFTDYLDGHIARRDQLVTNFGKLMDPLADKLLVCSAMVFFVGINAATSLSVFIILAREFLVTSVRLIAAEHGKVIAADKWGKLKTVFQIVWVLYTLLVLWISHSLLGASAPVWINSLVMILEWIVVVLTVFSGFNYVWKNRELFSDAK